MCQMALIRLLFSCVGGQRGRAGAAGVIAVGALLLCAGAANAAVTIGPERIEVKGDGAGAIIQRSPFRITFMGADGAPVLSELANTSADSMPLARSVIDPASEPTGPTVYSPLSFLVGSEQPTTFSTVTYAGRTSGQYSGDLKSVAESGTEYSAREVLAATESGPGVRMTLSTNDPSGETLTVVLTPQETSAGGAIRVAATPSEPDGVAAMSDSFASTPEEAFHGFGGRHNLLDQHGQEFFNWVDQENVTTTPETPSDRDLYPDGPEGAYFDQSSFVSNLGYGFFLNTDALSRWSLDAGHPEAWQAQAAASSLEYLVAPGSMKQAIATTTSVTGRERLPPSWGLGPLFDREVEEPDEPAAEYEKQVESDLAKIVKTKLPVTAYRIEGWGFVSKAFLAHTIARLRELGIKPLVYFRPFVANDQAGTEFAGEYDTAVADGYVATEAGGIPYIFTDNFAAQGALIDFTNPAAVAWWRSRIDSALELGAEGFMLDFGEQVQPGMHFSDGSTGVQMHNRYPVLYQRVTREVVEQYEAEHQGRSIVFFTRSGYSGEPGSIAYTNFNFPGDESTDWTTASGLAAQTPDMLNRAIGGAYGFGTDIGGYLDYYQLVNGQEKPLLAPTTRELFLRWSEWAALSPVFRLHGAVVTEHTPWSFPKTVRLYTQLSKLHISAKDLIESLWRQADETGVPVTRPLYLEYPEDPQAALQEQEWMLGPDVLVAPVVEQGASSRSVYFPAGCWHDPETGQQVTGPASATAEADIAQLPFFFRCGTRPFKPPGRFATNAEPHVR